MSKHSVDLARALYADAHLPDLFDPHLLARHARVAPELIVAALDSGVLAGRELAPGEWRITKRAALAWIESREEVSDAR